MLTKKHFEAVAAIIHEVDQSSFLDGVTDVNVEFSIFRDSIRERLADYFESENPRFDREKFIDATYGE